LSDLTLTEAIDNIYTSLRENNADIDVHIAALKAAMAKEGAKEAVFDPMKLAQNLGSAFGKIFRIDPLGTTSGKRYGIPAGNPFVKTEGALPEIYAYGVRNPQHLFWDPKNGSMLMSDIGQNTVEEISPVTAGANLGWNVWEGSYKYIGREGINLSDSFAYSDSMSDLPMLSIVGHPAAVNPDFRLRQTASANTRSR